MLGVIPLFNRGEKRVHVHMQNPSLDDRGFTHEGFLSEGGDIGFVGEADFFNEAMDPKGIVLSLGRSYSVASRLLPSK